MRRCSSSGFTQDVTRSATWLEPLEQRRLLAASDLDPTFGNGGIVSNPAAWAAFDLAIQADNKVVTVGQADNHLSVVRYNTDGSVDSAFGANVVTLPQISATGDIGRGVAIDQAGRIVVAGMGGNGELFVARLLSDGTPDPNFGGNGLVVYELGEGVEVGEVAVRPSGQIVVVATADDIRAAAVVQLEEDGDLDPTFGVPDPDFNSPQYPSGAPGVAVVDFVDSGEFIGTGTMVALAIQNDGKIVIGGSHAHMVNHAALARVLADGSGLDTTFGAGDGDSRDGMVLADLHLDEFYTDLEIDAAGNIYLVGTYIDASNSFYNATVQRYTPSGALDGTWGNGGEAILASSTNDLLGLGMTLDSAGRAVVVGTSAPHDFLVGRFDLSGNPDTSFAPNGYVSTVVGSFGAAYEVVEMNDGSGRLIVAGDANLVQALARYGDAPAASPVTVANGEMSVTASNDGDTILITSSGGQFSVVIDNTTYGPFASINNIEVSGGSASDVITVLLSGNTPVNITVLGGAGNDVILAANGASAANAGGYSFVDGGAGNDLIGTGWGNDVIIGGDGNDSVVGGGGRDLIIGGLGSDLLVGNIDEDIIIAGYTSHDADRDALLAIMAEWTSTRTYSQRVANIRDGSGTATRANGNAFFNPDGPSRTVFDDAATDLLFGGAGNDWFFFNADAANRDFILDQRPNEQVADVDLEA
ncbi:hypothetical protein [Fontivita pretiosa]|uniref:hypothetical protein n=1 Tax=Fontivita pretiosa TaxID=2989684 RepID=UPI003D17CE92